MKDLLSTTSSLFIILFSLSLLFLTEEPNVESGEQKKTIATQRKHPPENKTTTFGRVQSVTVRDGVLIFVAFEKDGLKEYYFSLRGKNVILCQSPTSQMPPKSIQFEESDTGSLRITLSASLDINLEKELKDF